MQWWAVLLIVIAVLAFFGIIFAAWWIATYNKLIKRENDVDEAYSTMDVYMKKRYDLIPNIVETVKGYTKHENETLENVMKARYSSMMAKNPEEKAASENLLAGTLKSLFAVTENYPDLKADKQYTQLINSLRDIETEIASSRKYYNGTVKVFNNTRETFPSNIVAKKYKFEAKVLFEIANAIERENPQVKF